MANFYFLRLTNRYYYYYYARLVYLQFSKYSKCSQCKHCQMYNSSLVETFVSAKRQIQVNYL